MILETHVVKLLASSSLPNQEQVLTRCCYDAEAAKSGDQDLLARKFSGTSKDVSEDWQALCNENDPIKVL